MSRGKSAREWTIGEFMILARSMLNVPPSLPFGTVHPEQVRYHVLTD